MVSLFPKSLDVFMTLVDGFHPITAADRQLLQDSLRAIQDALGAGVSRTTASTTYGPKGGNLDVATRLSKFLDPDGGLKDIAFVTGSTTFGDWTDAYSGHTVGFGKTLAAGDYTVLLTFQHDSGDSFWSPLSPCMWHVAFRNTSSVTIKARDMVGQNSIAPTDSTPIKFGLLAIGAQAYYE